MEIVRVSADLLMDLFRTDLRDQITTCIWWGRTFDGG